MFSQEQWASLRTKLVGWKDRMKQLLQVQTALSNLSPTPVMPYMGTSLKRNTHPPLGPP